MAQSPMQNTIRDFWKMIHDRQCASVVMLCEVIEDGNVSPVYAYTHVVILKYFVGSVCTILAGEWCLHLR